MFFDPKQTSAMNYQRLSDDVWLFVGKEYESAATAFINGAEVLLVDSLASERDAKRMQHVMGELGLTVTMIASTHYMSDHIAGISLFPEAMTIAHENYRQTFLSQTSRTNELYVDPKLTFDRQLDVRWGRHHLRLIHNPGKTMDHITVDAPEADLVCAGDNIVGNIVYLSKADPNQIDRAIGRIQQFGRSRVVSAHMGLFPASTLQNARDYLANLRKSCIDIRRQLSGGRLAERVARITIEECLPAGVTPQDFEREWHKNNLAVIVEQDVFELDAATCHSSICA
jgi:cyclase